MQNSSVLTTGATRKTTRFSVRDAKYDAAGAIPQGVLVESFYGLTRALPCTFSTTLIAMVMFRAQGCEIAIASKNKSYRPRYHRHPSIGNCDLHSDKSIARDLTPVDAGSWRANRGYGTCPGPLRDHAHRWPHS